MIFNLRIRMFRYFFEKKIVTFKITPTQPFIVFSIVFNQSISFVVRWRFVIHAGIDGYLRKLVYINCFTDNRADTVLQLFKRAVNHHGLHHHEFMEIIVLKTLRMQGIIFFSQFILHTLKEQTFAFENQGNTCGIFENSFH